MGGWENWTIEEGKQRGLRYYYYLLLWHDKMFTTFTWFATDIYLVCDHALEDVRKKQAWIFQVRVKINNNNSKTSLLYRSKCETVTGASGI